MKTVLISGASIAGPSLAWWLRKFDIEPVIVELAPRGRTGGHAIDVRGVALHVLAAMGLEERARALRTRVTGSSLVNGAGEEIWRSEDFTISAGSFHLDSIEILRGDLSNLLIDGLPRDVEIIYGDTVSAIEQGADSVRVTFRSGASREFDLAVGADGLGSNVRRLIFGKDEQFVRPFNYALAPFSLPNIMGLEDWQITYREGASSCSISTAHGNERLRASFGFPIAYDDVPVDRPSQIATVRRHCSHMKWIVPELMSAMEVASDFYLGSFAQVIMPAWTAGRIALLGDAAYCPSPYSGQGTSLALVGAYVLACKIAAEGKSVSTALAGYEGKMRPFVEANQAIADLTRDERLTDPVYYKNVVEPALSFAKNAIVLDGPP